MTKSKGRTQQMSVLLMHPEHAKRIHRDFGGIVRGIGKIGLPLLGTALGGPAGGVVGDIASSFLKKGGQPKKAKKIKECKEPKESHAIHDDELSGFLGYKGNGSSSRIKRAAGGVGKIRKGVY